jgi:hypothetical protein
MRYSIKLHVYVAGYNMQNEINNTLFSILDYQKKSWVDFRVTVLDNGSCPPMKIKRIDNRVDVRYIENASKSPLGALNVLIAEGQSEFICVVLDGARLWSPGVLRQFYNSVSQDKSSPSTVTAYHLGPVHQSLSLDFGYDKAAEILMLETLNWRGNGYSLFDASVLAGSNPDGEKGQMNESCCLFLERSLWNKIGGFNENFTSIGGGFGTLDLFNRLMLETKGQINVLAGEGCFHQIHGGISTSSNPPFKEWENEYTLINGKAYTKPIVNPVMINSNFLKSAGQWIRHFCS